MFREIFKKHFPEILVFSNLDSMYEQYPPDDFSSLFAPEVLKEMNKAREAHTRKMGGLRRETRNFATGVGRIIDIP